jgi:hypothetical protein
MALRARKHETEGCDQHPGQVTEIRHAKLSSIGALYKSIPRFGTNKSQGRLDGKFRANWPVRPLECHEFSGIRVAIASFRGDPEPQAIGDQRHRPDTAEPERHEPQQTLCEWAVRRLDLHQ